MKKSNKKKGMKFEKIVERTINSGALWFDKGDLKNDDYVIDCKMTDKKGFRITNVMLEKLWDEALNANKLPKLIIGIENEKYRWLLNVEINKEAK